MEQTPATRRACWIGALLPVCFAIWLHGPMWDGGLLSDDLVLRAYVVDPGSHGPVVAWRRVMEDLQGPWLFGAPLFYRPLVTFTFVLEYWLSGGAEWMPHVTNIALAASCVLGVGRLAGHFGGPWAAFSAGMLFAAHPAGNELICWPCARADLLLVAVTVAALAALARQRRAGGLLPGPALYCACIAAVLSKESGLMVALLLVLFDLMLGGGTAWRRRTALHLALLPVWLLYLWWRTHLGMMPAVADLTAGLDWSGWPSLQLERLSRLVAPGATAPAVTVGLFTAFVAVTAGKTRGVRRWIVFAAVWVAMTFAPTSWQPVFPNLLNGRSLVLTSLGLALAAGVVNAAAAPRWWARVGRIALVVAAIAMGACVRTLQDDYARQWQRMRALREQVAATAPRGRTEAPLVLLSLHLGHDFRLPFLDVERAYPLAATPLVPAPIPFVSLGSVLDLSAGPMMMAGDVTAWRVMWQHRATLAYWRLGDHGGGELVTIDGPGASTLRFSPDANGFVPDRGPASPWSIGSLEVAAGAAFSGGRVGWQAKDGSIGEFALGPSRQSGAEHRQTIDVSTDASFVMFATLGGGIVRMTAALDGPAPPRATALVALPMPELAPLRRTLRGAPMALSECGDGLAWNSLPADAEPGSAAIVLMNRSFGFRVSRPTPGRVELPRDVQLRLWQLARFPDTTTYYYLECRAAGRTWRSEVDWFVAPHR